MSEPSIGLYAAGPNGLNLVVSALDRLKPAFVAGYAQRNDDGIFDQIRRAADDRDVPFIESTNAIAQERTCDVVMVAGWQYLFRVTGDKHVIFHDSLLPRYRGFAPTVAALVNGERRIGITAFRPVSEMDAGPILAQAGVEVTYPCSALDAYALLRGAAARCLDMVIAAFVGGHSDGAAQDEAGATYSMWRDEADMFVDWEWPADRIARFVSALGTPFTGAKTKIDGTAIVIERAEAIADVRFEERFPGKFWRLAGGCPEVVCGSGLLRVLQARTPSGEPYAFTSLRKRFER